MKLRSGLVLIIASAALFAALAVAMPAGAAGTCYVNDDAGGANDGTDWANAYTDLQSAIADSCTEIWVAAGTYKPDASLRAVSFALESGTAIYGTPTLTDVSITDNSVTSYGGGLYLSSASATLTNVTISNNTATGGGGIYMTKQPFADERHPERQ